MCSPVSPPASVRRSCVDAAHGKGESQRETLNEATGASHRLRVVHRCSNCSPPPPLPLTGDDEPAAQVCDIVDVRPSHRTDCRAASGKLEFNVRVRSGVGRSVDAVVWATEAWLHSHCPETHPAWARFLRSSVFTRLAHDGRRGDRVSYDEHTEQRGGRAPVTVRKWRYPNGAALG
jgi:hypothetical protein